MKRILLAILFVLCCTIHLSAQSFLGTMTGTVTDSSGNVVQGARVSAVNVQTNDVRNVTSDNRGDFSIPNLEPGTYRITATSTGFKTFIQENVVLSPDETLALGHLDMRVGAVNQEVTVTAEGAEVQTASADRETLITSQQVDNLIIQNRNLYDMMELVPGMQNERVSSEPTFTFVLYADGGRYVSNDVLLDGASTLNMSQTYTSTVDIAMNAIAEVQVLNGSFKAEYGHSPGATISVVSKSGTKDFHGMASYFLRNEDMNANDFFNKLNGVPRPPYRYNTPSYAIGGPVFIPGKFNTARNKLFFFWTQEFWPTTTSTLGEYTVPTALERTGDFSQSVTAAGAPITILDPNTHQPVPGNMVPVGQKDASGFALLDMFPLPNFTDVAVSNRQYNYVINQSAVSRYHTHTMKIDFNPSPRNQVSVDWSARTDPRSGYFGLITYAANTWPQMAVSEQNTGLGLIFRYNAIITPSIVNEVSFAVGREGTPNSASAAQILPDQRSTVGFTAPQINPANNPLDLVPNATFGGVTNAAPLSIDYRFPQKLIQPQWQWNEAVTWVHKAHIFKFGATSKNEFGDETGYSYINGAFNFGTSSLWPDDTKYAYANAAYGVYQSYEEDAGRPEYFPRATADDYFAQDTWKVTPKLTLDIGIRIAWLPFPRERTGNLTGFVPTQWSAATEPVLIRPVLNGGVRRGINPVTGAILPASLIGDLAPGVGNPYDGMVNPNTTPGFSGGLVKNRPPQYGPRFGFAWDPFGDGKTAVRGGAGITYEQPWGYDVIRTYVVQVPLVTQQYAYYGNVDTVNSSQGYASPTNVFGMDPNGKMPTTYNMNLTVQRELGYHTLLDVAYVPSFARHLENWFGGNEEPLGADFLPANADPTNPSVPLQLTLLLPKPGYGTIYNTVWSGTSSYNSLQVSLSRRFSKTLQYGVAFTHARTLGLNGEGNDRGYMSLLVPTHAYYYGPASIDRTNVMRVNYQWTLPKASQLVGGNKIVGIALDGWQTGGLVSLSSGEPLGISMTTNPSIDITGSQSLSPRPNIIGNINLPKSQRSFGHNFNTAALAEPAVGTYGNESIYPIRGPGLNNWDNSLFKDFQIERARLQLRVESYNTFNHPSFTTENTAAQFNAAGTQINAALGKFTADKAPRQLQVALSLNF